MTATDPGRTAYEALAERLRAWGENDADPAYFQGDALSCVLLDCGAAGEAIAQLQAELAASEAYANEVGTALVGLTCDGSEFYRRAGENFRVDPASCVAYVRRQRETRHDTIKMFAERAKSAEVERDGYRTAYRALWMLLDPFVAYAACVARHHPGWDHNSFELFRDVGFGALTMGIFRQARAGCAEADETLRDALEAGLKEQGGGSAA